MTATLEADRSVGTLLDDLEAGRLRAAEPDLEREDGWRVRPEVKAAILACFADRTVATWSAGPMSFRDRAAVPPRDLADGPWRIVPGGTAVRRGAHLGENVVVMPPSYVNIGAWVGDETMVDSHVLVGSCAQIGARVHLSAGVSIGGVLEPAGARPVIVEDDAFVGAGSALLEGVLVRTGAVIGAGVTLTGTSRLYDLVRERVIQGTADRPLVVPARGSGRARRPVRGGVLRRDPWAVRLGRPARQGPRRPHLGTRGARGCASMSLVRLPPAVPRPALRDDDPAPRRGRPPARNEILRAGRLGGLAPEELAQRFGTPLYVYDLDVIDRQVESLRAVLPPVVDLAYAVKANPALAVVAHLGRLGLGADVASAGELATALRAGIDPARIVMTGPGKRDEELRAAVAAGIRAVTVESPGELARLEAIAAEAGRRVPVLLRASVTEGARLERVRLVGDDGAGKFGMDAADLVASARRAAASPHLELLGLHAFGASNVLDAPALVDHVATTVRAAVQLARAAGTTVRVVDAGGGLGIPYETHEESLDLVRLGSGITSIVAGWPDDPMLADARLLLEPGRFLVGPAGAYLARVVDRKTVDGSTVVVLDGGVHHVLRPVLVGQEHRVRPVSGRTPGRLGPVTVAGPLCSGLDVFSQHAIIPTPEVGDLMAVLDVGAYGFTESMPFFLSHAIPAEVVARGGRAALVRPRQEPGEWLDRQVLAEP